jgi:hypothetical protein
MTFFSKRKAKTFRKFEESLGKYLFHDGNMIRVWEPMGFSWVKISGRIL